MDAFDQGSSLVRRHVLGRSATIDTPFGRRLVYYADLTATGRHLDLVEAWVDRARAHYANTHTAVATTGAHMTRLREDARAVIRRAVGAGPDDHVLFCGSGATAATNKLVGLLGWRVSEPLARELGLGRDIPPALRPVVFVGPYEHHSNELPWRESVADVVTIDLDARGRIDLADLEAALAAHHDRPMKLGAFSAASNVTGVLTDVAAVARLLHRHGALAVFDFAASGPYVPIDMHPADPEARLDAIVVSPHKFVGGPESSGVLVASAALFRTRTPERPGGGTVEYVSRAGEPDYARDLHEREEGGTPAIMGDLRAGLAFLVKDMVGAEAIRAHEIGIARAALERLSRHPRIRLLGPTDVDRLAIVSFNVEGLHHDLVSALLDHLFGIQNRAGCACAGPYGHRLLGIDEARSERFRALIHRGVIGMKPGWVRLSLPWYATADDLDFVLGAVELVADHGEAFLPLYRLGWQDGVWHHAAGPASVSPPLALTLASLLEAAEAPRPAPIDEPTMIRERARYRAEALAIAAELEARRAASPPIVSPPTGDPEIDALAWFRWVTAG